MGHETPHRKERNEGNAGDDGERETGEVLRLCPYCTGGRLGHTL